MLFFISCGNSQEIKSISTSELKSILAKGKVQLLDVRTPEEINKGTIETAIFADFFADNFTSEAINQLDKSKPVYMYCRSGGRSLKAAKILQKKGFETINILGGYNQWKQEN